ncbi:MAG: SPASM domain-containing protein [Pseudomonadota bacterium]|nr:SPASM domain-containing protein [Pseudomonadota bacterium]
MNREQVASYDEARDFSKKKIRAVCYAPFSNLFFDQSGGVRVCCWNAGHLVGDVRTQTIDEIWHGEALRRLRRAMMDYSFALGCQPCERQVDAALI